MNKLTKAAIEARPGALGLAIEAAGSIGRLAHALGIAQAAVAQWERIPAERVIAVEKATGIRREILRPDLYPPDEGAAA